MNDRLSHQCHKDNCDSEARWSVKVHIPCRAVGVTEVVSTESTIRVCDAHRPDVRAFLLSDANKEVITTTLMENGHPEPDFLGMRLEFLPIEPEKRTVLHVATKAVCDRDGCHEPARWQIKQMFRMMWQGGKGKHLVEALTNMCVCTKHRAETTAADFLDQESKSRTLAWLAYKGVAMPDFDTMEIAFVPLLTGRRVDPNVFVGPDQPKDAIG